MKKIIVTAEDINESLCDLDTEYREALAHGLMHYKYISDSPLNLSMGSREKQKELERVMTMPLKSSQLKEIINFISNEMKGDFQYNQYSEIENYYIQIASKMEKEKPKCALIGQDGNIFNLMGIASRTLKTNGMSEEAKEMVEKIETTAKSYDEALNIMSDYVEIVGEEDMEEDDEIEYE